MLNIFREGARTWASKVLIYGIAATFVGSIFLWWGRGSTKKDQVVAVVAGEEITRQRFDEHVRKVERTIRDRFAGRFSPAMLETIDPRAMALNSIVENVLQVRAARREGLQVSDRELTDIIENMPEFQRAGVFSRERYIDVLTRSGVPPRIFEEDLREDLLMAKLRFMVQRAANVSDTEALNQYLHDYQPVVVEYVSVPAEKYVTQTEVTEEEAESFYDRRKEDFRIPEKRTFKTLAAPVAAFEDRVEIADGEVERYYDERSAEFSVEDRVTARHILAKAGPQAAAEEAARAKEKIDRAAARLAAGEDFEVVAKEMSEGPSAEEGGSLGTFGRGVMVPEFEEVVFGLEQGEVSEPFRTSFGWHIAQAVSREEAMTPPLEKIRAEVEQKVRRMKARKAARGLMKKIAEGLTPGGFAEAVGEHEALKLETHVLSKGEPILSMEGAEPLARKVFELEKGRVSDAIELADSFVLAMVDSVEPSRVPPLEQVRDKVEEEVRLEKSVKKASAVAERIAKKTNEGMALSEAAAAEGLEVKVTEPFSRRDLADMSKEKEEGIVKEAFALDVGEAAVTKSLEGYMAIRTVSRPALPEKEMGEKLAEIRDVLLINKRSRMYTEYLAGLREEAEKDGEVEVYMNLERAGL
ncbi:MAG: SurA N-terminal domain-containing protein [Candidatus Nitrospinota bacterium M3_3B_026]